MSELHDRLERLAARGTRRGADDVLHAARRDPLVLGADSASRPDDQDRERFEDDVPFVGVEHDGRRGGRFGALVAAAGVAALVGVGALAVTAMFGSGGAGSPEGAVRQLADAVTHKDALAAVDVLVPSEVRSMRQTVKDVTKRAADLKIVDDASQPLAGVDLSVDHLQLSTETLADGFAKVTVTSGVISSSTHSAAMSQLLQDAMRNSGPANTQGSADLARLASADNLPTFVIAVRRDGRWYVSPAYTALEYAREVQGGPAASFGSARAAQLGADSPEAAVTDALHAWQAGNWEHLVELAPPDELPVYDYRAWIDQAARDTHPDFTIEKLSTSVTVNGTSAVVQLEASGTTGSGSGAGHWQVGGTCPATQQSGYASYSYSSASGPLPAIGEPAKRVTSSTSASGAVTSESGGDVVVPGGPAVGGTFSAGPSETCLSGDLAQALPFGLMSGGSLAGTGTSGSVPVDVVEESGRWFVSPVTTALDALDTFVSHLDARAVYPLIGLGYALPPDATISLNQPFTVSAAPGYAHVYAFDGSRGQAVVGEAGGSTETIFGSELYTADGHDVGSVAFSSPGFGFSGGTTTLPATGGYRLVVEGRPPPNTTLTLFDSDHAPKSLLNPPDFGTATEQCSKAGIAVSCSSSASTPTTVVVPAVPRVLPDANASGGSVKIATTSVP